MSLHTYIKTAARKMVLPSLNTSVGSVQKCVMESGRFGTELLQCLATNTVVVHCLLESYMCHGRGVSDAFNKSFSEMRVWISTRFRKTLRMMLIYSCERSHLPRNLERLEESNADVLFRKRRNSLYRNIGDISWCRYGRKDIAR